jgi:tRNA(fMet)-specific endonuclease VapC
MRLLLDTNAYSRLMLGDQQVLKTLNNSTEVIMSVVVIGELQAGFIGGRHSIKNFQILSDFLQQAGVRVINITSETAEVFAEVKHRSKTKGTPIPINDVWIAAHAIETGTRLLTFDKHFHYVDGIRLVR